MKKIIAVILVVLALSALAVTAFASASPEAAAAQTAAPAQEETTVSAALTEEQALAAALKDAGLKEADVTVDRNKLTEKDTADGGTVAVYSVKFSNDTTTCKYYIDANTGAILYKSFVYQSADVVFVGRGEAGGGMRAESDSESGDEANAGKGRAASGEMSEDASGETGRSHSRRSASADAGTGAAPEVSA